MKVVVHYTICVDFYVVLKLFERVEDEVKIDLFYIRAAQVELSIMTSPEHMHDATSFT